MKSTRSLLALAAVTLAASGCVSFNGPNDIRDRIAARENVRLDQTTGVTVGPVGVLLGSMLAGPWLPVSLDGLSWVSFGEYDVCAEHGSADCFSVRDLEMDGWDRVLRICDAGEEILVMVNDDEDKLEKVLFVQNEGGEVVRIARVEGDLEKVIDRLLESGLVEWEFEMSEGGETVVEASGGMTPIDDAGTEVAVSFGWGDREDVTVHEHR